jgi:hypothetical protein
MSQGDTPLACEHPTMPCEQSSFESMLAKQYSFLNN